MLNVLSGGVNCHLSRSGHLGGNRNKKRPRASGGDGPAPERKCSTRSKVAGIFTSGTTASLIKESFPNQKGVVVSKSGPVAENLFNMSLDKITSDVEWEPTVVEILTAAVSLVVGDPVEDPERPLSEKSNLNRNS